MSTLRIGFAVALTVAAAMGACGGPRDFGNPDGGDAAPSDAFVDSPFVNPDGGPTPPPGGDACTLPTPSCTTCSDFPAAPIIDPKPDDGAPATPSDAATHFTQTAVTSGGPCISEPQDGTLIPQNWLRPRFRYAPASSAQTLFQIKLHAANQQNDYVVYTTSKTYKLPAATWDALRASTFDMPITLTVAAVDPNGSAAPVSASTTFTIAPAGADGSMIYWAATGEFNGQSWLEGFRPGDEGAVDVLDVSQVQFNQSRDQGGQLKSPQGGGTNGVVECIGCHTAIPDGQSVGFLDFWPWGGVAASVADKQTGQIPTWLTPGGMQAMNLPWLGISTYSKGSWATEKVMVTTSGCDMSQQPWNGATCSDAPNASLIWVDLGSPAPYIDAGNGNALGTAMLTNKGTSYGVIARSGDTRGAAAPTWSHDGKSIVYVSTNAEKDGRLAQGVADLWTVPYAARAGGTATALAGASDSAYSEFYPSFGPDDRLVAFNRAPSAENMYYNAHAEVFIVPAAGGTATRLAANDPPTCSGQASPGVTNSWAKFAPSACVHGGKTYYWIIFSSSRGSALFPSSRLKGGASNVPTSQLYITAVIDDGKSLTTTPAMYIWNQPLSSGGNPQSNHTPVWEVVDIPPVPPPK